MAEVTNNTLVPSELELDNLVSMHLEDQVFIICHETFLISYNSKTQPEILCICVLLEKR